MDANKKPIVPPREKIEELSDAQLSQVNGGLEIPTFSGNVKPFGQAVKKPSCFTKSDDHLPSNKDF